MNGTVLARQIFKPYEQRRAGPAARYRLTASLRVSRVMLHLAWICSTAAGTTASLDAGYNLIRLANSMRVAVRSALALMVSYADPRRLQEWNAFQRRGQPGSAPTDPQLLNRYAYARNNPLAYTDDSGNVVWWVAAAIGGVAGGVVGFGVYALTHQDNFSWEGAALYAGGGALIGATFGVATNGVVAAIGAEAALAAGTTIATAASSSTTASRIAPELGNKLNYVLGQATGSLHNIQRSQDMLRQLQRIGHYDNAGTRQYLTTHLTEVVNDTSNIVKVPGQWPCDQRVVVDGTNGALKVESIWEGAKLITITLLGG